MTAPRKPLDLKKTFELDVKRVPQPQPHDAYLPKVPGPVHTDIISSFLNLNKEKDYKNSAALSTSCVQLYSLYQPALTKQHLHLQQQFLQAVVDDRIEEVKSILNIHPGLLLDAPKQKLEIESQYTWQRFNLEGENALTIAAKRRQLEMLESLMPYVDKLQNQKLAGEIKADVLSKWPFYEHKEEKNEFHIPAEYITDLKAMIEVFKNETFPNGTGDEAKLSDTTEIALQQFRNKILPENAVTLAESVQVELLLYAAYKIYDDGDFDVLKDSDKQSAYRRYIHGFIQSLLSPKDAEKWCEGLVSIIAEQREISERARSLKLIGGENFYRSTWDSFSGLGGRYFCGGGGEFWRTGRRFKASSRLFGEAISSKNTRATRLLCSAQEIDHALKIV